MADITVNGEKRKFSGDPNMPLLWFLRDELGLTGTKFGCGVGVCGACTVHVDGEAVRSCVTTVGMADGKAVTTIEGLSPDGDHAVQKAWRRDQRPAVRLLPGRPDHAGGGSPRWPIRAPSDEEIVERCPAISAAAAAISASMPRSALQRGEFDHAALSGQEARKAPEPALALDHRERQPPAVPRRGTGARRGSSSRSASRPPGASRP